MTIAKKTKMEFLVFAWVLYTSAEGFEAPPELVHEVGNLKIQVLGIEGNGRQWKGNKSDEVFHSADFIPSSEQSGEDDPMLNYPVEY